MLGLAQSIKQTRVYQEGREEGKLEGKLEGKFEEAQALVVKQLARRIGSTQAEVKAQVEGLSLEQLESLAEALLNFSSLADLQGWLATSQNRSV